ncbi:MAG: secretin N-terminal domain-containing protein [bacterium]
MRRAGLIAAAGAAAACFFFCPWRAEANRLEKLNVQATAEGVQVKAAGAERLKYKVSEYKSPPHVVVQFYDTQKDVPYDSVPVNEGNVDDVRVTEQTINGQTSTFVSVNMYERGQFDFDVSPDGKTFTLTVAGAGARGVERAAEGEWAPPPIKIPGREVEEKGRGRERYLAEREKAEDTSPFITGPINLVDADISEAVRLLSDAFGGVNIVVDGEILREQMEAKTAGGAAGGVSAAAVGITVSLTNVTLEDALDAITSANNWKWQKLGNTYVILDDDTDEYGFELSFTHRFFDPAQDMDVLIYKPKYVKACNLGVYASAIIPIPGELDEQDYFLCEDVLNIAIWRGTPKDLERVRRLLDELDTPEVRDGKTGAEVSRPYREIQEFVTRVVRLKYIRAEDLYDKVKVLMDNPYFGQLEMYFGYAVYEWSSDNTLYFDESTNSLIYVGREKYYERVKKVIDQLDAPYSATVIRMIPLKYVNVTDLQSDQGFADKLKELLGRGSSEYFFSEDTNSITFIGTEDDYDRMMQVLNTVDVETREYLTESVAMENMRVEDLKSMEDTLIKPILGTQEYGKFGQEDANTKVTYNPVSNTVIIAAQRQYMDRIKTFFKSLDREPSDFVVKKFKLKYVKAERAVELLKGIVAKREIEMKLPEDGGFFTGTTQHTDTFEFPPGETDLVFEDVKTMYQYRGGTQGGTQGGTGFGDVNKLVLYAENMTNSIVASGTKSDVKRVEDAIGLIDTPYPQIKLDVQVVELRKKKGRDVNLGYVYQDRKFTSHSNFGEYPHPEGENRNVSAHNVTVITGYNDDGTPKYGIGDPYHQITGINGFFLYDTAENFVTQFATTLRALITEENGNFIAEPSIIAAENMLAKLDFTDKIPYVAGVSVNQGVVTPQPDEAEIGFTIYITPHFTDDGSVVMNVNLKYSSLKGFTEESTVSGVTSQAPIVGDRSIQTEAKLRDGQPLIIGGMIQSYKTEIKDKVPVLGDLPLFGKMFRSKTTSEEESEIIVVITPRIIPTI